MTTYPTSSNSEPTCYTQNYYDWCFRSNASNPLHITIPLDSLSLLANQRSPLIDTPLLTLDECWSDCESSPSPITSAMNFANTEPLLASSSLILDKNESIGLFGSNESGLTFLEFVAPPYEAKEDSVPVATVLKGDDEVVVPHHDTDGESQCSHPPSPPTSPIDTKPSGKSRSNSLGSLYKDIDISACKKTKTPGRRGSVTIFSCPFPDCSRSFDRSFNLRAHYSTHLGMKFFTCEGCSKKFTRQFDVKRHQSANSCCTGFEILVDN